MQGEQPDSGPTLAERLVALGRRVEKLPGMPFLLQVAEDERRLGGGLIAGGVAFRLFLWLAPFGLVAAALTSFWVEYDAEGLESAAKRLGLTAAAAEAAAKAIHYSERSALVFLVTGLVFLAWFTLGAIRALTLSHALAWGLEPPKLRRPFRAIAIFNGLFVAILLCTVAIAWLREAIGAAAMVGALATMTVVTAAALAAMWLLPHRARSPRELLPGAIVVAVGHQAVQIVALFYFAPRLTRSEATYGALGVAATLLIWIYVISRLITGSAFLNAALWRRSRASAPLEP